MTKRQYMKMIKDSPVKNEMIPIFDLFENYVGKKRYNVNEIVEEMKIKNATMKISELHKAINKSDLIVLQSHVRSFSQHLSQFTRKSQNVTEQKWKKILLSYLNLSRVIANAGKLSELIKENDSNIKIILALGLVDIGKDDIKVNDEIDEIVSESSSCQEYCVFPIYGCNTNLFAKTIDMYHFPIVHFAGHCEKKANGKIGLSFVDSSMLFDTLQKYLNYNKEWVFLNCCSTLQYTKNSNMLLCRRTFVHDGEVSGEDAKAVSVEYYREIFNGVIVSEAWENAMVLESEERYSCLE